MKMIITVTVMAVVLVLQGCKERSFVEPAKYQSLRSMQTNDIEKINKKIVEYESDPSSKTRYITELNRLYFQLGQLYTGAGNWNQAIEAFENAVKYGKDDAQTQYVLGVAYANRGKEQKKAEDLGAAERHYRNAIGKKGMYPDAEYGLAVLLFYEKDAREQAVVILENLLARAPSYYRGFFALGRFYYEMNKPKKALTVYEDLYARLEKVKSDSPVMKDYRTQCRENIERIMREESGSR
jgi:tetratricopeptide (TPR) repeat protein